MKRLALFIAFILLTVTSFAQHLMSREVYFGVTDASVTSYKTSSYADTAGATVDTVNFSPNKKINYVHVNVVDSSALRLATTTLFYGDIVDLDIVNPSITGNYLYLYGNWIVSTGTKKISLTSAKSSYLRFWFNGTDLVETSRNLNYTR